MGQGNSAARLENQVFNLKFASKQMVRMSKKSENEEKVEKKKLRMAIEKQNAEGARIYAQNAIRQKNQALNYLRLSSRLDAVASRLESAMRMNSVTASMGSIVQNLDSALNAMNIERVSQVMDQFERQFENLDVQSEYVESAMTQTTSLTTPADQVDRLIQEVGDAHGIEVGQMMTVPSAAPVPQAVPAQSVQNQDELAARFNRLKGQ
eukprot:gnl/Trimastix_PCT/1107.p3 GENE.gnl/Trimastix_PCT/1107~~gnl/Trimastix_PCT/1107.p3  ORF type:complete len:208 (-),score=43.95 gnl/Trimastix_PCT/1107:112-735(-)